MQISDQLAEKIGELIAETNPEVFLIDLLLNVGRKSVLSILVDTDKGITIDECARISRAIGRYFEEDEVFDFPYNLEVSSPGVGKPLKVRRQYHKNIGRRLKVVTVSDETVKGILSEANDEGVVLTPIPLKKGKKPGKRSHHIENDRQIAFEEIKEAKVEISFD